MTKVDKCRKFGANVIQHGAHIGEAREFAIANHPDLKYINGYNDPEIIAGAGSMAIEILEQVPHCDAIVVPVGGAGLIAGISLAIKTLRLLQPSEEGSEQLWSFCSRQGRTWAKAN
jgi:threonine dehydratase